MIIHDMFDEYSIIFFREENVPSCKFGRLETDVKFFIKNYRFWSGIIFK